MAHGAKRVSRAFGDTLISIFALSALLITFIAVDDGVREQVSMRFHNRTASMEFAEFSRQANDIAGVVMMALRDRGLEHGPILIFALAAIVLVIFMLRT